MPISDMKAHTGNGDKGVCVCSHDEFDQNSLHLRNMISKEGY